MTWDAVIAKIEAGPETRLAERGRISQVGELARATAIEFACHQRQVGARPPSECHVTSKVILSWQSGSRWRSMIFHENGLMLRKVIEIEPQQLAKEKNRKANAARA